FRSLSFIHSPLLSPSVSDDHVIGPLVAPGLVTACRLAPGRHRVTAAGGLALTAAVRVIDRVHSNTAYFRTFALPAISSRLTERNVFVLGVADLTDSSHTDNRDTANFA